MRRFEAKDIGAELLPIITRGLYKDPLDTLREYVQNAIDAQARQVHIRTEADLVSIRDDGTGMTREVAERAIRLGMSEKKPNLDVGFRGIGVYSAYNICDCLEIFTRPKDGPSSKLVFDFLAIRKKLEVEEKRRLAGEPASLHLEKLLENSVWLEESDGKCPLAANGTLVIMNGIKGDVHKRLTDRHAVASYLESVVPLPFHPEFHFKDDIEARFRSEDYRVVDLELAVGGQTAKLFRPYRDTAFDHLRGIGPKFFELENVLAKGKLGFAWVCLNDARRYLRDRSLRGLLVRKFGFSVGGRDYFTRFFSREVFNNRVTGEIIVTHPELLPNAARSDFEAGPLRDGLHLAFTDLAARISKWANDVQEELKAKEELQTISPKVFRIVEEIPACERDVPRLLELNNDLTSYKNRLNTHERRLKKIDRDLLDRTVSALEQARKTITEILSQSKQSGGRMRRTVEAKRTAAKRPTQEELTYAREEPRSLMEVIRSSEIEISIPVKLVLNYIDEEVLRSKLEENEYRSFLVDLLSYLEESL